MVKKSQRIRKILSPPWYL